MAFLAYKLATIQLDIPVNINIKDIILKKYSSQYVFKVFRKYILKDK